MHMVAARLGFEKAMVGTISINDSMLPSVCYTVIYMIRVGLGLG